MIFGNPTEFAIEAYHEPSGPKWGGYGRLCLKINNVAVGDIRDNHCSLFVVTDILRRSAKTVQDLWVDAFKELKDDEIFQLIDDEIYFGKKHPGLNSSLNHFDFLTNSAEMFDGTKTFIFCSPDGLVHILFQLRDGSIGSGVCQIQIFRDVVDSFVRWFEEQVPATAPPYFPINPFDLNEKVPDNWNV